MRVVHIIKIVLTAGAERHLLQLLPGLAATGVDIHLIVLVESDKPMDDFVAMAADGGIHVERMVIRHHIDVSLLPRLTTRLRAIAPDLVHTHLLHADLYGTLAARYLHVPSVISRHNDNAFRYTPPMRLLNRGLWCLARGGIAISEAVRRFCIEVEGANPSKIHTIHYGLPASELTQSEKVSARQNLLDTLGLPPQAFLFGTVSRLIEQKGLADAITAFHAIHSDYTNSYLLITGEGMLRNDLIAKVAALGLSDRVRFLGWREDARDIMAGLDVFLMPSLWEGFGLVLLEAMACRLPIIGTDVSAIPEIVLDEQTGLIVPPHSPDDLAGAMRRLAEDPQARKRLGERGHQRLRTHFTEQKMAVHTQEFYRQILAH